MAEAIMKIEGMSCQALCNPCEEGGGSTPWCIAQ